MKKLLIYLLVLLGCVAGAQAAAKPNILVILSDDQRADCVGAVNPRIHTPNMDRLAREGVLFNQCYIEGGTSAAVCTPSRTMVMTGRNLFHLPKDIFAKGNKPSVPVMSTVFRADGYDTLYCGKHGNTYHPADRSFDKSVFISHPHRVLNGPEEERQFYADPVVSWLAEPARKDKPFFVFYAPSIPHDPLCQTPRDLALYSGDNLPPLPANAAPSHQDVAGFNLPDTNVRTFSVPGMGQFKTPLNLKQWPEAIARYYAFTTLLDRQIGYILDELKRTGADKNTLIVFASDNGLSLSDQGLIHKQSVYEQDIRVPLIVSGPGIPAGRRSDALVDLADLFPTLCEWAGVPIPDTVQTKSFRALLADPDKPHRTSMYHAYREHMRALRDGRYKLNLFYNGHVRLFDLGKDPFEMHDLAQEPAQAERVARMITQARETGKALDDDPKNMPPAFGKAGAPFWAIFNAKHR